MKHTVSSSLNFSLSRLISEDCKKQSGVTCLKVTWRSVGTPSVPLCFHRGFLALDESFTAGRLLCVDLPVRTTPSRWQSSVCSVSRCERGDWGGVHHGTALHQQNEVWGEVPGEPQQAVGERPDRLQQEDERQREGACSLPAPHFTSTFDPPLSLCSRVWWLSHPPSSWNMCARSEKWDLREQNAAVSLVCFVVFSLFSHFSLWLSFSMFCGKILSCCRSQNGIILKILLRVISSAWICILYLPFKSNLRKEAVIVWFTSKTFREPPHIWSVGTLPR